MLKKKENLIVVIPSYEPTKDFIDYAKIVAADAKCLLVVNDGSSEAFDEIFDRIAAIDNVVYLKHEINRGKGCALKTAFGYCAANFDKDDIIVTADCDGQHATEDVLKVYETAKANKDCLVLGARDFSLENIPSKSKSGNESVRNIFRFFYGLKLTDTQTGLRGFSVAMADEFTIIRGERFEYEMGMLIYAKKNAIRIVEVGIKTIYPATPEEHTSHYRPFKDGMRILGVVFKNVGAPSHRNRKK